MPNPSGVVASSDTNPASAGHEPTRNAPASCAPPFRPKRPICHKCPLVLARVTTNRSSRLSEVIRNMPLSCIFVSGEAPLSCSFASATSRRLKRRGEARRRSFDLSSPLQAILCSFDLQAVGRRGGSRGGAVSQTRRAFVAARKRKPLCKTKFRQFQGL